MNFKKSKIMMAAAGSTLLAGLVSSTIAATLGVQADAPDALIVPGAPTSVTVSITPDANEQGTCELHQVFVNRYDETTNGPTLKIDLSAPWKQQVQVPVEYYGPATYRATLTRTGDDKPLAHAEQMLIRPVPVPHLSAQQRFNSPIGTNTHAGAHWKTLAAMGIHWARDYSWGWLGHAETAPHAGNGIDFTNLPKTADAAGITILPILQQAFRTPDKKAFITDANLIASAYEKLSNLFPSLPYWELDNESDLANPRGSDAYKHWFETYLQYIPAADKGLDAAGHGAKVVLNGDAGIHPEQTRELLAKVGEHFAVVNYHAYTGTVAPELAINDINTGSEHRQQSVTLLDRMRDINRIAHAAGKQAWLSEIAWSADGGPAVGYRLQSAYLNRIYLLGAWAGTDKTFWFWDRNMSGGGRFSGTGLIDQSEEKKPGHHPRGALPAGAAMATVSKFIAQAHYAGSVDIGKNQWCLVFKNPDGTYTVAAWAVGEEHEVPAALAEAKAFGMYGNPLRKRVINDEPAYFMIDRLPGGWEPQLQVQWVSASVVNLRQGDERALEIQMPEDATATWQNLPEGAQGEAWKQGHSTLHATAKLAPGTYAISAVVKGKGWQKQFPVTLKVQPALSVDADAFTASQPAALKLTNMISKPITAQLSSDTGQAQPLKLTIAPGDTATVQFIPKAGVSDPVAVKVSLDNGGSQQVWLRPRTLAVPHADKITLDGNLSDWPQGGTLTAHALKLTGPAEDFAPGMKLAWSDQGLYVAATIPVGEHFRPASDPKSFWEWTSVEMNMQAAPANASQAKDKRHLLWFVPVQDEQGGWRIYAGEWLKPMPTGKPRTINDDHRMQTACHYDGQTVTVEVLVPVDVLGAAPRPGEDWPLTISSKIAQALSPRTVAAWPAGSGQGSNGWGRIHFLPAAGDAAK